jgi:hypothetical protein
MVWQAAVIALIAAQQPTNQAEILRQGQDLVPPYVPSARIPDAPRSEPPVDRYEMAREIQREAYAVANQCLDNDTTEKRRQMQIAARMTDSQYQAFLRDCLVVQWAVALQRQRENAQK